MLENYIKHYEDVFYIKVKITPKSKINEVFSVLDDWTVKIRIKNQEKNDLQIKNCYLFYQKF